MPAPNPIAELSHPGNRGLFAAFKPFYSPEIQFGSYNAHPELAERLYDLEPPGKMIRANAYGFPVMANAHGLVFAWAKGQWTVLIRLGEAHLQAARKDKGRSNSEYGSNWIEFPAWWTPDKPEPTPTSSELEIRRAEWSAGLRRWMQIAHEESLQENQESQ